MSAETVARWKAIPLNRPESDQSAPPSLKRLRDDEHADGDDSDDDISLVSRSPSPPPVDAMDVDKYDEYYTNKPEPEVVTVETKIKSSNIGFSMLAKMGWVEGSPLGLSGDGRVDPVPFYVKNDLTGLGKSNQDVRMIESTVSQRRGLDSERQTKESEEQRRQREDAVARRAAVQSEISSVLRPFYCEVCEKQFQNVAQYDEHTNSYAHHHKVRFRDMQAAQRASRNTEEEVNKRKEKERKREEKELRKLAKAAGVKMTKPPVPVVSASTPATESGDSKPSGFKKAGWATVPAAVPSPPAPTDPPRRSGWATVGEPQPAPSSSRGGWAAVSTPPQAPAADAPSAPPPQPPRTNYSSAPSFRTGGWTSLETSTSVSNAASATHTIRDPLPPPITSLPPPPPVEPMPPSSTERPGWANVPRAADASGWNVASPAIGRPATNPPVPPVTSSIPASIPPPPAQPAARQEGSRSGWQKFRAGAPGRRR